jgi:hypothetical protein
MKLKECDIDFWQLNETKKIQLILDSTTIGKTRKITSASAQLVEILTRRLYIRILLLCSIYDPVSNLSFTESLEMSLPVWQLTLNNGWIGSFPFLGFRTLGMLVLCQSKRIRMYKTETEATCLLCKEKEETMGWRCLETVRNPVLHELVTKLKECDIDFWQLNLRVLC